MSTDWRIKLVRYLIGAGTVGRKWGEIIGYMERNANADQLETELDTLWAEDKVQRFQVPPSGRKGRKATVWRATTKLLDHNV